MKKLTVLFLLFISLAFHSKAQYYQTGQDPASIKWRQINTVNFQVIYPEEFEKQAQRISYVLEKVYDYGALTLNYSPKKVSVVLHTRTVDSNGLMAWAPKRIELFTTPNQQIYAQDWLEQLALHEFRHLVQLDKIQSEMPALVKALLGEQAAAIVAGAYLPFWFLEGDAVVAETALSNSGRGREASFSMEYRAQLIEKGKYSFNKAYLGSYKDFVPDYYCLGYWMVGKNREKFGTTVWSDVLRNIGRRPFSITPLNSALKKNTKQSASLLYSDIFDNLAKEWKQKLDDSTIDSLTVVSPARRNYTDYLYPSFYKDSAIFAYRTSLDDIGRFVLIYPGKKESVIYTPGKIFGESVSMQEDLIIWAERRADVRWTHSERSVIRIFNLKNKTVREIKNRNKLFGPVISPDSKTFAAVEVDQVNNFFLSVLDLETGVVKHRFNTTDNQYFITPCWDTKGETVYVVCLSANGKYLASVDVKSGEMSRLTDYTFANLKNPVYSDGQVIFSADFSGVENLYALDTNSRKIKPIASVAFGSAHPAVSSSRNQVLFSNYSAKGFGLATINLHQGKDSNEIKSIQLKSDQLVQNLSNQEKGIPEFSYPDSIVYQSKKYSKLGHLFNFHSWAPAFIDVNSYEIRPGFSLFSQNKLGSAETRLGYDYNVSDRTGRYKLAFTYSGLFPEISAELSAGNEASSYYQVTNTVNSLHQVIKSDTVVKRFTWSEMNSELNVRLPLNVSKGRFSRAFIPEVNYTFNRVSHNESTPKNFYSGYYHEMSYRLYLYNLLHQSTQDLMPGWGQQFEFIFRHTPFKGNDLGAIWGGQSALYFPGLINKSGLKLYQGYQEKNFTKYSFGNFIRFPRGFQSMQNNKMYSLAVDYKFPFFYPDFSVGKFLYFKRLKSSLFYDYAWLSVPVLDQSGKLHPNYRNTEFRSCGLELSSDLHVLRFVAPFEFGIRSVYRPELNDFRFDLLISMNFNVF